MWVGVGVPGLFWGRHDNRMHSVGFIFTFGGMGGGEEPGIELGTFRLAELSQADPVSSAFRFLTQVSLRMERCHGFHKVSRRQPWPLVRALDLTPQGCWFDPDPVGKMWAGGGSG